MTSTNPTGGAAAWSAPVNFDLTAGGTNVPDSVSCPSVSLCIVVDFSGNVLASSAPTGGAGAWNPVGRIDTGGLVSVSCPSVSLCAAVDAHGNVFASTNPANAGAWTAAADIDGAHRLNAVSCVSGPLCVAVDDSGNVLTSTNPTGGAGAWSAPVNLTPHNLLDSVSCASSTLCVAGDNGGNVLVSTNPTGGASAWSGQINVDGFELMKGLSCPSASLCVAVDDFGNVVTSTNPAAKPPTNTSPPSISGTAMQGQTLAESHGVWTNSPTSFTYQWQDCDSAAANCNAIFGATAQSYTLAASDVGHTIRVQEIASGPGGQGAPAVSAATGIVQSAPSVGGTGSPGGGTGNPGGAQQPAGTVAANHITTSGATATVTVACRGTSGATCVIKLTLTATEVLRGRKVIAITAAKTKKKVIVLGAAAATILAGHSKSVKLSLNSTGKRLLSQHRTLKTKLTISQTSGGHSAPVSTKAITFKATRRKHAR